jgi:hypothetical protein
MAIPINLIPLDAITGRVLDTLPKDSVSADRIEEWAYEGYENIAPKEIYEIANGYTTVYNHSAPIPEGAFRILMVLYRTEEPSNNKAGLNDSQVQQELDDDVVINAQSPDYKPTEEDLNLKPMTANKLRWKPLMYTENVFHNSVLDPNSPNVYAHCNHSFSINARTKCIITSFDCGDLAIAYTRIPRDDDGNWLIPDFEYVKKAIETYCLKRYWQWKMNLKDDGAIGMYRLYSNEWSYLHQKLLVN